MSQQDTGARSALSLEERVARIEDLEAIRQTVYTYVHGTDRCQSELIADAYHHDAYDDHGSFSGGRDDVVRIIMERGPSAAMSFHHVGNVLIELLGDVANVESYFMAAQTLEIEGRPHTRMRAGRYLDRFERRDGRWRIAHRQVADDWSRLDEVVATAPNVTDTCSLGTRDRTDPSYDLSDFTRVHVAAGVQDLSAPA